MFYIVPDYFYSLHDHTVGDEFVSKFTDMFAFLNCSFVRNANIETMIYVESLTYSHHGFIHISNSTFHNNTDVGFLRITEDYNVMPNILQVSVSLTDLTISNNDQQYYSNDLILITNAYVVLSNNVFANNYYKYKSVIKLQSSAIYCTGKNRFTKNKARYIIKAQMRSMLFIL